MRLPLRRAPANPFDPMAVEIPDGNGTRLGSVPRAAAGSVAALLDAGAAVEAEVSLDDEAARKAATFTDARRGDPRIRPTRLG